MVEYDRRKPLVVTHLIRLEAANLKQKTRSDLLVDESH